MTATTTDRGFDLVEHPNYLPPHVPSRLVQTSSAVGDYPDSFDRPGSSFLWIGDKHHLNREEVRELVEYLNRWLESGRFCAEQEPPCPS